MLFRAFLDIVHIMKVFVGSVRKRSMVDDLNITDPKMINLGNNELNRLWNLHADNEAIIRLFLSQSCCVKYFTC